MRYRSIILIAGTVVLATSCGSTNGPTAPGATGAAVVKTVVPSGGASGVDPAAPITVTFSHAMMQGMEMLVVLHEGSVTAAGVTGTSTWSRDRTQLTFTPAAALKPQTTYVLHFSPNMKDSSGAAIDWPACAGGIGGTAANAGMFGGGMMNGGGMGAGMMGSAWQPGSGTWGYGMLVTFTTA